MRRDLIAIYGAPGTGKTWLAERIENGDSRMSVTVDGDIKEFRGLIRRARAYFDLVIVTSATAGSVEKAGFRPTIIIRLERPVGKPGK
jgi:broad-specificity NMP kinase